MRSVSFIRRISLLVVSLVVVAIALVCLPPTASAADDGTVPVRQVFTTDTPGVDATFTYRLVADDYSPATPMPAGSTGDTFEFTLVDTTDSSIVFDCSSATVGVYVYHVADATTPHREGYTYEPRTYTVRIYVGNDETLTTIERDTDGMKVSKLELDPSYTQAGKGILDVVKSIDERSVAPGATVTYTVSVANIGTADLVGVWVKDHIPAGTTFVSADNDGRFLADSDRGAVSWFLPRLAAGERIDLHLQVRVDADLSDDATIENVVRFQDMETADPPDPSAEPGGGTSNAATTTVKRNVILPVVNTAAKTGDAGSAGVVFAVLSAAAAVAFAARRRVRED